MKLEIPGELLAAKGRALASLPYGGRWLRAAMEGRLFTGNAAAAGAVLPIYSNTAQVFGLWNPAGSGVIGEFVNLTGTYVDTTGAAGGFVLGIMKNAGSSLATGGISAFTEGTPENSLGNLGANKIRFTPSAATVITPTIYKHLGINQLVLTAATTGATTFPFNKDFDGDTLIYPNSAVFVAGNIATLSKWAASVSWVEHKVDAAGWAP